MLKKVRIDTGDEAYVEQYLSVMNCCFDLSDRELAVLTSVVNQSNEVDGVLELESTSIKDVKNELGVTNGYLSSMMNRIKNREAIRYDKLKRKWIVNKLMNPFLNGRQPISKLIFEFNGEAREDATSS